MSLDYRARKRLSLLVLVIGLPVYIVLALNLVAWATDRWGRLPLIAEFAIFVGLGLLWIFPLKGLFLGIGQADPDAAEEESRKDE